MFRSFADPDVQDLLRPPYSRWDQGFDVTPIVLSVLLCLPFLLTIFYAAASCALRAKVTRKKDKGWKPWALQYPYLLFINSTTVALIATVVFLYQISECP